MGREPKKQGFTTTKEALANVSLNVVANNNVWMKGCRDMGIVNNSYTDNFYACRKSECCDDRCSVWRNNASICLPTYTNYTGAAMPAAARAIVAAAGPRSHVSSSRNFEGVV